MPKPYKPPKPAPKPKPPSQRDRGYTNILHHLTKNETKQNAEFKTIEKLLKNIMATLEEQTAKLNAIGDKLDKAAAEIIAGVQALKDAQTSAGSTTPEEDAATARLEAGAQALDDVFPDPVARKKR